MKLIEHHLDEDTAEARPEHDSRSSSGTGGQIIAWLLRYSYWVIAAVLVGAALGFFQGAVTLNVYAAGGKLLVRTGKAEAATAESAIGQDIGGAANLRDAVATELQILANPNLLERVCDLVGANRITAVPDPRRLDTSTTPWPTVLLHDFQAWWFGHSSTGQDIPRGLARQRALMTLASGLEIRPERSSSVISVTYFGKDPEVAHDVVQEFMNVAAAHHREVFSGKTRMEFLQEREEDAWEDAKAANDALHAFNREHGIYDLKAQLDQLTRQASDLVESIHTGKLEIIRAKASKSRLEALIQEVSEQPELVESTQPNPEHVSLRAELKDLETRKLALERRTGETTAGLAARREAINEVIGRVTAALRQHPPYLDIENSERATRLAALYARLDTAAEVLAGREDIANEQKVAEGKIRDQIAALRGLEFEYEELSVRALQTRQRADGFSSSLETLQLMEELNRQELGNLRILHVAPPPTEKVAPDRIKSLAMGSFLGAAIGLLICFVRGLTDSKLWRPRQLSTLKGEPVLAVVKNYPQRKRGPAASVLAQLRHESPLRDVADNMWARIFPEGEPEPICIGVAGASPGVGCTTITAATAAGLAQLTDKTVLVVETDFNNPTLAQAFELENGPGLGEVLLGAASLQEAITQTPVPGLSALCAGSLKNGDAPESLIPRLRQLVKEVQGSFHYVFVDIAPMDLYSDTNALLWEVDATILVVSHQCAETTEIASRVRQLRRCAARFLGTVFNRYRSTRPFWLPGTDPELLTK